MYNMIVLYGVDKISIMKKKREINYYIIAVKECTLITLGEGSSNGWGWINISRPYGGPIFYQVSAFLSTPL